MGLPARAPRSFASDNYAGVHPDVLAAVAAANTGHEGAYGADAQTARLGEVIRERFGERAEVYPVFNGTGANVVALESLLPRWGAVVATGASHIHNDEGGAPERVGGFKLLTVDAPDGKLTPELAATEAWGHGDVHRAQPLAISITQSTELGTLYLPDEIRALADFAHDRRMALHLDGSRLWNAAAALELPFREFTTDAGVDILSLGGTKNGALGAEGIVVLNPDRASGVDHLRKASLQLASKMRFLSAQLLALFEDGLGLRLAAHANAMAARLRAGLEAGIAERGLEGLAFSQPTRVNAVFATLPGDVAERIRERFSFYDWNASVGEVRWMTAFDTEKADVDAFVMAALEALAAEQR